jgi:chemotaxis signal transduction protein
MTSHQVLEFILGEEQYCIDIEYVTEVVSVFQAEPPASSREGPVVSLTVRTGASRP